MSIFLEAELTAVTFCPLQMPPNRFMSRMRIVAKQVHEFCEFRPAC